MAPLEGFLMKQGEGGLKTWKRRWFSVKQGNGVPGRRPHLYYYEKKDESNPKGKIDLTDVISVTRTTADLLAKGAGAGYEFNITIPRRVYKLRAATENDMVRWVEGLREVQARAPTAELLGGESAADAASKRLSFRHSMKTKFKKMAGMEEEGDGTRQPSQRQTLDLSQLDLAARAEEALLELDKKAEAAASPPASPAHGSPSRKKNRNTVTMDKMAGGIEALAARPMPPASDKGAEEAPRRATMSEIAMAQSTGDISNLDLSYITNAASSPKNTAGSSLPKVAPAEEKKEDEHSSLPKVTIDAWMTDNEDREVYTLRKKLAEALGVIDEKQNEIRQLQTSLDKCHKELEAAAVAREAEMAVDHDKKRREAELSSLNDKLEVERRQRREMETRYNEVKDELALLKKNLHLTSNVPSLQPDTFEAAEAATPIPGSPARPRVQIIEPTGRTTEPVRSLDASAGARPKLSRDSVLQKSMSMSSMAAVKNPRGPGRAPWMEDYLVTACPLCNKEFGLFNRRHHCRACGNIYCGPCSMYKCRVPGYKGLERVCNECAPKLRGSGGGGRPPPKARPKSTYMGQPPVQQARPAAQQRRNSDMSTAYGAQQQRMPPSAAPAQEVEVLTFD